MGSFNPITLSRKITSLLLFFRIQSTGFVLFTTFQPESSKSAIRIAKKKASSNDVGFFFIYRERLVNREKLARKEYREKRSRDTTVKY